MFKFFGFIKYLFGKHTFYHDPSVSIRRIYKVVLPIWSRFKRFLCIPCLVINKLKKIYKEYEYYLEDKERESLP